MSTVQVPKKQRLVLYAIPWENYTRILRVLEGRHLRLTYDRGVLEIMTLSFEHESKSGFLIRLVDVLTVELNLPVRNGKSTTFRRKKHKRGLEADGCWWIKNEHVLRGKKTIDLRKDPPPDLALEVDITTSSLNRLAIYAKLGVPEVWRFRNETLAFLVLNPAGKYEPSESSLAFPGLTADSLQPLLLMYPDNEENSILAQFRAWVRQHLKPKNDSATATSSPSPVE